MEMKRLKRTWAEIDLDNLEHNLGQLRGRLEDGTAVMAIVKANAYGHGDASVSRALDRAGVEWFGVSNVMEARTLRRAGITKPILVLGYTPVQNARELFELSLTQCLFSEDYAEQLAQAAARDNMVIDCHIKLDTGMARLGFDTADTTELVLQLARICYLPNLKVTGIYTHFAMADDISEDGQNYTKQQHQVFETVLAALAQRGFVFPQVHCCNSAGILYYPEYQYDMVRPGIALYGLWPSSKSVDGVNLRPVLTLKSVVAQLRELPAGARISYGGTFKAYEGMKVATVPIGYADGYPRALSGRGYAYVNEKLVPVVGRVCMDYLMLDVTEADTKEGDEVTLFGGGSPVGADNIAGMTSTISNEILCGISGRVQRVYIKNGEVYETVDVS